MVTEAVVLVEHGCAWLGDRQGNCVCVCVCVCVCMGRGTERGGRRHDSQPSAERGLSPTSRGSIPDSCHTDLAWQLSLAGLDATRP